MTRKEARAAGLKVFSWDMTCRRCHTREKDTRTAACAGCAARDRQAPKDAEERGKARALQRAMAQASRMIAAEERRKAKDRERAAAQATREAAKAARAEAVRKAKAAATREAKRQQQAAAAQAVAQDAQAEQVAQDAPQVAPWEEQGPPAGDLAACALVWMTWRPVARSTARPGEPPTGRRP